MSKSRNENLNSPLSLSFEKINRNDLPKCMTHAKPIHVVINTLYRNDVHFGDKNRKYNFTIICL